jgi:hypothetical protein
MCIVNWKDKPFATVVSVLFVLHEMRAGRRGRSCYVPFYEFLPEKGWTDFDGIYYYYYYSLIHSLTAIGLSPGGSSPTLVQTKIKIHKTTKLL